MTQTRKDILFYAAICVAMLPVMVLRDFTPSNELRYLSIADEAIRNHSVLVFYNHGVPYADKPPLYLWIVMLCRLLAGKHCMWLLGMFSLLPAMGVTAIMDRWVGRSLQQSWRIPARLMLITTGLFLASTLVLRMDMLMVLFIVLALKMLWNLHENPHDRRSAMLLPVYIFLGIFTKGPLAIIIPLVASVVFLTMNGEIRTFFRYWGWLTWGILLLFCILWFGGIYLENPQYLDNLLVHQTVGRAVNSFHHKRPFYYYLIHITYCLYPWVLLVLGTIIASWCRRQRFGGMAAWFVTIAVTTIVVLSCISGKLQIYMLPAMPFFVYGAVLLLQNFQVNGWIRGAVLFPAAVSVLMLPAAIAALFTPYADIASDPFILLAAAALTATGVYAVIVISRRNSYLMGLQRGIIAVASGLLLAIFAAGWAMPKLNPLFGYADMGKTIRKAMDSTEIEKINTWKIYRPENLDVYIERPITVISKDSVPADTVGKPYLLVVPAKEKEAFHGRRTWDAGKYSVVEMTVTNK